MTDAEIRRRANRNKRRYARHFAGQNRATRDLTLLRTMHEDQKALVKSVAGSSDGALRDAVASDAELFEKEIGMVEEARAQGTPEQQARLLGTLANHQFQLYRDHFAGKSRATRRPALLKRLVRALGEIEDAMKSLKKGGYDTEQNNGNLKIVTDRIKAWKAELDAVESTRAQVTPSQMVGLFGGAANDLFALYREDYAGKDRATRDLAKLSLLCDQLTEVALLMEGLEVTHPDPTNSKNLGIVTANLDSYEREWDAIRQTKAAQASS